MSIITHCRLIRLFFRLGRLYITKWFYSETSYYTKLGCILKEELIKAGPMFVKLGQIMAIRHDVFHNETLMELQKLLDNVPDPVNMSTLIKKALPNISNLELIGCGSIAQVYKGRLNNQDVAVKVRKPNIQVMLNENMENLGFWLFYVDYFLPRYNLIKRFTNIKESINSQISLKKEVNNMILFNKYLKTFKNIKIPKVMLEYCSDELIVMEFVEGCNLSTVSNTQIDKEISKEFLTFFFLPLLRDDIIHGDMHPGNLRIDNHGKLWILDFGLVYEVDPLVTANFFVFIKENARKRVEKVLDWVETHYISKPMELKVKEIIRRELINEFAKNDNELVMTNIKIVGILRDAGYSICESYSKLELAKLNAFGSFKKLDILYEGVCDVIFELS